MFSDRPLPTWLNRATWLLAIGVALFHILIAYLPIVGEYTRNALHFGLFVLLCALVRPAGFGAGYERAAWLFDVLLGLGTLAACWHLVMAENAIYDRGVRLVWQDWLAIGWVIGAAIEFSRRVAGWIVPLLIVIALTYIAFWGAHIPGVFRFGGLSLETLAFRSVYGDDALFGTISRISSTFVFLFILFGAFLVRSGAGEFVIDLAKAVAGRLQGGPGIVAVLASGLTGTISGSAVANTASTGVITIPMMKKAGFPPHFAGGVEAAASTGGQLMPPIMGAGAFVMAGYTQIPYESIALAAALPAALYFASVIFFVRIRARKLDLAPMEGSELTLKQAFKRGGASFIIPISLLIALLVYGLTPTYAAVFAIVAVIASSWLTERPMRLNDVLDALALGSKNMIMTAILLCAVGLIVNVIATAGVGNTFSLMISDWAGGSVLVAIVLIAIASLVLGMGLPVTAAYIVLATLSAPALAAMISDQAVVALLVQGVSDAAMPVVGLAMPGFSNDWDLAQVSAAWAATGNELRPMIRDMVVPTEAAMASLLAAHMIIFWLSQDSNVTPPVCLAAFTGAAIAKAPPMRTGIASWRLAKGLYIVPVLFAYTPLLEGGTGALWTFATALLGIYLLAGAMEGHLENRISILERGGLAILGAGLLLPDFTIQIGSGVVAVLFLVVNFVVRRPVSAA